MATGSVIADLVARITLQDSEFRKQFAATERYATQQAAGIGRALSSAFRFAIPATAGAAVTTFFVRAGRDAENFERSMLRLQGVLKATGNVAGLTANELDELARDVGRRTLASTDEIREAEAALLTFRSIAGDTFKDVIRLSADLAELGFGTVQQATIQMAKALEDPIRGMGALRRVGVSFTADQEKVIKSLAETGKLLDAQKVLVQAVADQVAGTGEAAAGGLAGAWDSFNERLDRFLERSPKVQGALNAIANAIGILETTLPDTPDSVTRLATVNEEIAQLREKIAAGQTGLAPGAFQQSVQRAFGFESNQEKLNTLLVEQAGLMAELQAREEARARAAEHAAEIQAAGAAQLTKEQEAEIKRRAKLLQQQGEGLARLQVEAQVAQGRAVAAAQGADALEEFNHQVEVSALVAKQATEAIDAGLSGRALGNVVIAATAAAEALVSANDQVEHLADASKEAERAAEKARRDAERQAQRTADALAEPFRNAFRDMQSLFTDTFEGMLTGAIDSWKDFWSSLKSIATRTLANIVSTQLFSGFASGAAPALAPGAASSGGGIFGYIGSLLSGTAPAASAAAAQGAGGGGSLLQSGGSLISSLAQGVIGGMGVSSFGQAVGLTIGNALTQAFGGSLTSTGVSSLGISLGQGLGVGFSPAAIVGGIGGTLIGRALGFEGLSGAKGIALSTGLSTAGAIGGAWAGGALAGIGGGLSGALAGAAAGSVIPVIGTIIGALIGALIAAFAGGKSSQKFGSVGTGATREEILARGLEHGFDITRDTPFGVIGVLGGKTSGLLGKASSINALLDVVDFIDKQLAPHLKSSEKALIRSQGLPDITANVKRIDEKLAGQRIGSILTALGIPATTLEGLGLTDSSVESQVSAATNLLAQRKEIVDFLDQLKGTAETVTQSEKALEAMSQMAEQVYYAAPSFGIVTDSLEVLQELGRQQVRQGFEKSIQNAIDAIENPFKLAAEGLAEQEEQRVREAQAAGADLVLVEKLHALQRERVLKEAFASVDALLDQIRTGVGIQTPSEIAAQTNADFRALASQVSAGLYVDPAKLAQAAAAFLEASRAIKASSVAFFDDLQLVQDVLTAARQNAAAQLPGFASGGAFDIPATAGRDRVVPLFRVSGGERVAVSTPAQRAERQAALEAIADGIAEGNTRAGQSLDALRRLEERLARHESELIRLARTAAGRR